MAIGTNLGYLGSYVLKKKKYIAAKSNISTYFYLAVGVIRHLLGRIMNVDLSYLPKCTEFFFIGFIK